MNIVDRMVAAVSPEAGRRRLRARAAMRLASNYYDGATRGRRGSSIRRTSVDINAVTRRDLSSLRAGSRDLSRNNPYARRIVDIISAGIVGQGIQPHFKQGDDIASDIEALKKQHLYSTAIDHNRQHNLFGLQSLAVREMVEAGECLVVRQPITNSLASSMGLPVPLQIQILDIDHLDSLKEGVTASGGQIIQGVQVDASGRTQGYWLYPDHPGSMGPRALASRFVPARDVIHLFRADRAEGARDLREKIAACFAGFRMGGEARDGEVDDQGNPIESIAPGMFEYLGDGERVEFATPPVVTGYKELWWTQTHALAAAVGVTQMMLTGDMTGANFASARIGRLDYLMLLEQWQRLTVIPKLCDRITSWFLEAAGAPSEITTSHMPPVKKMLDPASEVKMARDAVRSGQLNPDDVLRERGIEPTEFWAARQRQDALLDQLEIVLDSDARRTSAAGLTQARPFSSTDDIFDRPAEEAAELTNGNTTDNEDAANAQ